MICLNVIADAPLLTCESRFSPPVLRIRSTGRFTRASKDPIASSITAMYTCIGPSRSQTSPNPKTQHITPSLLGQGAHQVAAAAANIPSPRSYRCISCNSATLRWGVDYVYSAELYSALLRISTNTSNSGNNCLFVEIQEGRSLSRRSNALVSNLGYATVFSCGKVDEGALRVGIVWGWWKGASWRPSDRAKGALERIEKEGGSRSRVSCTARKWRLAVTGAHTFSGSKALSTKLSTSNSPHD
jgi:hypothetical protein